MSSGIGPGGISGSSSGGGAPSGTAGGDLSGTYPNPTVAQLNGVAASAYAALAGAQAFTGSKLFTAGFRYDSQAVSGTTTLVDVTQPLVVVDTTSAAFTITLPAAPSSGSIFIFVDKLGTWATNNLTIARNGKNIDGAAANKVLATPNGVFALQYNGTDWRTIWDLLSSANPAMDGSAAPGTSQDVSRADHVHPSDTSRAALASPTFTGTPAAPTAAQGTNTTQLATTAMVHSEAVLLAPLASPTFTGTVTLPVGAVTSTMLARTNALSRTGALAETFHREQPPGTLTTFSPTAGALYLIAIELPINLVIGHITFLSGTAAAVAPTHQWFGLYNSARVQLATTTDDTSTAWGGLAEKTLAISQIAAGASATFTTTYSGLHYIGIVQTATTSVAQLTVGASNGTLNGLAPILIGTSDTAQTTPPAFAHTGNAITATGNIPYAYLSA